jgi:hypothetical protein
VGIPFIFPQIQPMILPGNATIENEFNKFVSPSNIRRLFIFDTQGDQLIVKDRSGNNGNISLSVPSASIGSETAGKTKVLNFNQTSEYWSIPDADDLSFGNGVSDSPFSIISCFNPNDVTNRVICAKHDTTTGNTKQEYLFYYTSGIINFNLYDDSVGSGIIGRKYNTTLASDIGSYVTMIATYSGNKNVSGLKIYRNGVRIDDANINVGSYTAMENKGASVGNYYISTGGVRTNIASSKMSVVSIVSEELSQAQITAIDLLLRQYVGII